MFSPLLPLPFVVRPSVRPTDRPTVIGHRCDYPVSAPQVAVGTTTWYTPHCRVVTWLYVMLYHDMGEMRGKGVDFFLFIIRPGVEVVVGLDGAWGLLSLYFFFYLIVYGYVVWGW